MKPITATELKKKLDCQEIFLIDVREPAEHRAECIDGACLIPLSTISKSALPSTTKPIAIHCKLGKRSQDACKKLFAENATHEIYFLEGGIEAWKQQGFAVKTSGRAFLPIDRQTQLAAGILAFSGVVLGALLNPLFYILSGFVGLGLIFAGLTGWCGMAKLLAKMPWNQ